MKKLTSTLPNMVMSLGIITIAAAALLAWTHSVTEAPIAAAAKQKQIDAIKSVAPKFNNDPLSQAWTYTPDGSDSHLTVFPAYEDGTLTGAAVEGYTLNGFSGEIRVMYGFAADGTITGYEVLSHAETPGLGAKMNDLTDIGNRSVIGRNPANTEMRVTKDAGGTIDAITAATISSRAFLDALRESYKAFVAYNGHKTTNTLADNE